MRPLRTCDREGRRGIQGAGRKADGDTAMTGRKGEITAVISSVNVREIAALQ
jgi:hypothetical protein